MSFKRNPVGSNRGLHNPKRGRCPHCGKLGVGPMKAVGTHGIFRSCRYCQKLIRVTKK